MSTTEDYQDLYLRVGGLLLVCVFETFRNESINFYESDLAHYSSISGYSWDEMLRKI